MPYFFLVFLLLSYPLKADVFLGFFFPQGKKQLNSKDRKELAFFLASYEKKPENLFVVEVLYPFKKEAKALALKNWLFKEIKKRGYNQENFYVTIKFLPIKKVQVNFYQKEKTQDHQSFNYLWLFFLLAIILSLGVGYLLCKRRVTLARRFQRN